MNRSSVHKATRVWGTEGHRYGSPPSQPGDSAFTQVIRRRACDTAGVRDRTGRPEGVLRLPKWSQAAVHQVAWQSTPEVDAKIAELHGDLDLRAGRCLHLHVHGRPGVGKTRFVLELCRNAPWREFVVYVPQASDVPVARLIDGVSEERNAALVVVVDEVQYEQLRPLRDALDYAEGRARLITIGHSDSPEPARIHPLRVSPLGPEALGTTVRGWHPCRESTLSLWSTSLMAM